MKNSYQRFINLRNSQKKNLVEETSKIELESLVKYFPLIGIFILLCSATELGFYYVYFSIDIFTFVETSEILTLYLGTVLILIIRLTIYITLGFYVVKLFVFGIDKIIGLFKKNKNRSGSKNRPTQ